MGAIALGCAAVLGLAACGSSGPAASSSSPSSSTAAAVAASSASSPASAQDYTLTILETTPGFFDVPIYGMINDGFAAQHHLTLKINQFFSGSASSSQIFTSGTGNVLFGGITAPVGLAQKAGEKVTIFGDLMQRGIFDLVSKPGSPIKALTDLPGKITGISGPGSFNDIALRYELAKSGVDASKVKIAALGGTATQYAALLSGKADAVQLQAPTLETALAKGAQVVFDFRKDLEPALVFTARTADVTADPTPYQAFIAAYAEVLAKMKSDPAYATDVATRAYGKSTSPADIQVELKEYLTDPGIWSVDGAFNQQLYDNGKAMMLQSGQYKEAGFPSFADLTAGFTPGQ